MDFCLNTVITWRVLSDTQTHIQTCTNTHIHTPTHMQTHTQTNKQTPYGMAIPLKYPNFELVQYILRNESRNCIY